MWRELQLLYIVYIYIYLYYFFPRLFWADGSLRWKDNSRKHSYPHFRNKAQREKERGNFTKSGTPRARNFSLYAAYTFLYFRWCCDIRRSPKGGRGGYVERHAYADPNALWVQSRDTTKPFELLLGQRAAKVYIYIYTVTLSHPRPGTIPRTKTFPVRSVPTVSYTMILLPSPWLAIKMDETKRTLLF